MSGISEPESAWERIRPGDPYFNYCYWPYDPPVSGIGKLRASALLFRAIQEMPAGSWLAETIRCLQAAIGSFRSVYGVKRAGDRWGLEIYLYDYERADRVVSIERLMAGCQGRLRLPKTVDSEIPYFMFSFDLDESTALSGGQIPEVHVYVGNPGSSVSSGISYRFTADSESPELENSYFFFDAADRQAIEDKLLCSPIRVQSQLMLQTLLPPQLTACSTICLANKRTTNTVYFSGVTVTQLQFFLQWQQFPESLIRFVAAHVHELDHLLFDVGVDYCVQNRSLQFCKSGFYGIV